MKRLLAAMALALGFCSCVVAADTKPVQLDLFWEAQSPDAWRNFFMADAVDQRLPAGTLTLKHHILLSKGKDGKWSSRKGEAELQEAARIAVVQELYPEKIRLYLMARSLDISFHGWQGAARFAGIDPEKLDKQVRDRKAKAFEQEAAYSASTGVTMPSLLLNGVVYTAKPEPLMLLEKINAALPEKTRVALPPAPKSSAPKMWVAVAEDGLAAEPLRMTKALGRIFGDTDAGATKVVYGSSDFKKNFGGLKLDSLPAYLFKDEPITEETLRAATGMPVLKTGGYLVFADSSEGAYYPERKRKNKVLELFVMSQCPYGVMAEQTIIDAMEAKSMPEGVQVRLHYIVEAEEQDGKLSFSSMHGDSEWEENARQLLIQSKHPEKLWAYLKARNGDTRSSDWESAAKTAGLQPEWISKNFEEAKKLLAEDAKVAQGYKISASPTFVWEGRSVLPGMGALSKIKGFENLKMGGKPSGSCN